jgi:hypothetical protein
MRIDKILFQTKELGVPIRLNQIERRSSGQQGEFK